MIWHIFRKDWRLLRWLVLGVLATHAITVVAQLGPAGGLPAFLGTALLIVLAVHQDALPGVRQDWLVRPIRRADMLLAKLLFVLVTVHAPLFVLDLLAGLGYGFGLGPSLGAALSRTLYMLFTFSLPVLALAALTRSMTEVAVALTAWFMVLLAATALPSMAGWTSDTARTGVAWVPETTRQILLLAGALAVLLTLYTRRQTTTARGIFIGAVVLSHAASFLPWSVAFAVQTPLSPGRGEIGEFALAFDPSIPPFRPAPGQNVNDVEERPGFGEADVQAENLRRRAEGAVTVFLPLRVTGLPPEASLVVDRSQVRVTDRAGEVRFEGRGNYLEVHAGETVLHGIRLPRDVFDEIGDTPVRLDVDYSLSRFELRHSATIPALGADAQVPGVGHCTTGLTPAETDVLLRCTAPGNLPSCVTVQLQQEVADRRNPERSLCAPNYRPFPGHVLPDAFSRFRGVLPFADPTGLARYPVDTARVADATVLIRSYVPREHRVQRVRVPEIRLDTWLPVSPPTPD